MTLRWFKKDNVYYYNTNLGPRLTFSRSFPFITFEDKIVNRYVKYPWGVLQYYDQATQTWIDVPSVRENGEEIIKL